jgi:PIN domain nuclease of toxin-antitoxin system
VILLDTCVLIFDALTPEKLTEKVKKTILNAEKKDQLFCCDISLWEIAMLIQKNRLDPGTDIQTFLRLVLQARNIQILPINLEIAALSTTYPGYNHFDPADRLIASTAMHYHAKLVTSDKKLQKINDLIVVW